MGQPQEDQGESLMQVKAKLQSYEALELTITLTAPVEDWRAMLRQFDKLRVSSPYSAVAWPASGFVSCIEQMLTDLDQTHADVLVHTPEKV
jgi:hypothetical protein